MFQRRNVPFVAMLGLLPVVLAACSDATSSTDPRTQPPLVRVGAVGISGQSERSFTGIVAAIVTVIIVVASVRLSPSHTAEHQGGRCG